MSGTVNEPLVSIIIPVYNAEEYLEESLGSVLNQSYKNIEVICVNDGSTDDSLEILKKFKQDDFRIIIVSQDNQGAGAARNHGLKTAKGEYVLFFDADDILREQAIQKLIKIATKKNTDVILFGYYKFTEKEVIYVDFSPKVLKVPINKVISPEIVADRLFQADHGMPWNKFYKLSFLCDAGVQFQNLKNTNDEFFSRITTIEARRLLFLNKDLVGYRVGNNNSLQGDAKQSILDCTYALRAIYDELGNRGYYEMYSKTFKKLAGYIIMLKLQATDDSESFLVLAKEASDNIMLLFEMDENDFEDCYKDAYRALLSKDFSKAESELKQLKQSKSRAYVGMKIINEFRRL